MFDPSSPLISIIVPVYNVATHLNKCIDSILAQTYKNIEILLINDGSTDESGNICSRYESAHPHLIKSYHLSNSGCSYARNFGVLKSSGEWISFVDSDDFLPSNFYSSIIKTLSSITDINNIAFAFCGLTFYKSEKVIQEMKFHNHVFNVDADLAVIPTPMINSSCNKLFPSQLIKSRDILFTLGSHYSEDMAFVLKCLSIKKVAIYVDNTHYSYNIHPNGVTSKLDSDGMRRFCDEVFLTYNDIRNFCRINFCDENILQAQIMKSLIPDFFTRLNILVREDKTYDWYNTLTLFESRLSSVANNSSMKKYEASRRFYIFKLFLHRHFVFFVDLYRRLKYG
ncbi:glycosyltransferase family 2 protein [Aeromonas veronii]|uniref:glycosyltransferase family 2 protein n=1 Tax=Aeromonas veronii TaxID=654 RepID=UPI003D1DD3BE